MISTFSVCSTFLHLLELSKSFRNHFFVALLLLLLLKLFFAAQVHSIGEVYKLAVSLKAINSELPPDVINFRLQSFRPKN